VGRGVRGAAQRLAVDHQSDLDDVRILDASVLLDRELDRRVRAVIEEAVEALERALRVFADSVSRSTTIPLVPAFAQYTTPMAVALSSVMSQSQSIDAAMKQAQQSMQAAFDSSK